MRLKEIMAVYPKRRTSQPQPLNPPCQGHVWALDKILSLGAKPNARAIIKPQLTAPGSTGLPDFRVLAEKRFGLPELANDLF